MYAKIIICTLFWASVAMQLAQGRDSTHTPARSTKQNTTKCFSCDSLSSCRSPTTVICDQKSANATRLSLAKHFRDVANVTNTKFECLKISYTLKHLNVLAISGCVNTGLNPCSLRPKNVSYTSNICKSCTKDLCNPAGGLSSSLAIMMPSISGLLLLKYLYL